VSVRVKLKKPKTILTQTKKLSTCNAHVDLKFFDESEMRRPKGTKEGTTKKNTLYVTSIDEKHTCGLEAPNIEFTLNKVEKAILSSNMVDDREDLVSFRSILLRNIRNEGKIISTKQLNNLYSSRKNVLDKEKGLDDSGDHEKLLHKWNSDPTMSYVAIYNEVDHLTHNVVGKWLAVKTGEVQRLLLIFIAF